MKVAPPKNTGSEKQKLKPPLPLVVEPIIDEDNTKFITFKLMTTPADANSPKYSYTMRKLDGSETLRQAIQFCYDIDTVIIGLAVVNATNAKTIHTQVLSGQALTAFNAGEAQAKSEEHKRLRIAAYETALNAGGDEAAARTAMRGVAVPADEAAFLLAGVQAIVAYIAPHKALGQSRSVGCVASVASQRT